jgi:hypothetical protein
MEMNLANVSGAQLRRAADIKEQIDRLNSELSAILGGGGSVSVAPRRGRPPGSGKKAAAPAGGGGGKRRVMSPEGRARIAAAARARWARVRAEKGRK